MTIDTVKKAQQHLIIVGVQSLRNQGFPAVTPINITSDLIYQAFFKSSLERTAADLSNTTNPQNAKAIKCYQSAIKVLLRVIQNNHQKDYGTNTIGQST